MAERVLQHTATIPAGTARNAPVTVALPFDNWEVESVDLEVPPGPAGCMGFYLANNGQWWVPRSPGEFLVWDDRCESFYATGWPVAGGWQIVGFNLGDYDHTVVVRFAVNPPPGVSPSQQPYVLTFIEREIPDRPAVTL